MDLTVFAMVIAPAAAISGILLGWSGRSRTIKKDLTSEAYKDAHMSADMDYIKRGVDDMRIEQKLHGKRFDELSERVTRVEESTKSAHHRIDRINVGS